RRADVDLDTGIITIHHAKLDRDRLVPLHPRTDTFFISTAGTALDRSSVGKPYRRIITSIGLRTNDIHPRIHDLRHSFAMRTLLEWQQSGVSVDERIAVLSTYLGHIAPADTYWYLEASPQLMQLAADRLDATSGATR
ncbi:integrase, partial [Nocardia sp. NPDC059246]